MKLIKPEVIDITQTDYSLKGIYKQIELAGRTCYKSEDRITEDSAEPFVKMLIDRGHCYTGESEVLTEHGWVKWKNYKGQKVAVINSDLNFKGFELPQRTLQKTYTGKFYEYPTLGIKVTEGHRMFGVFRLGKNDFYNNNNYAFFNCCSEFVDNNGRHKTDGERMFKTPRHCFKPLSTNPYMELVGFWLGDGCYNKTTKNKIIFHLKKQRKIKYLKELTKKLGLTLEAGKNDYYRIEQEDIGRQFNKLYYSEGKNINIVPNSAEDIHSVITGLINSDGSLVTNTKTITYTSTSKSIIDWICNYAPLAGYTVSYRGTCTKNNCTVHKILLLTTTYTICNDSRNKKSKVIITNSTEKVYCVTVSTGLIMVRGINGITTICGNCAMLEHGTVYLRIRDGEGLLWSYNPYSYIMLGKDGVAAITTNLRVIQENHHEHLLKDENLQYTFGHFRRVSFRIICSIGIARELCRHRVFSFAQESTRYCNYGKEKFDEMSFIEPYWYKDADFISQDLFKSTLEISSVSYRAMINNKMMAQQAREVLPLATKTELVMTGTVSQWKALLKLRLDKAAHPDMRIVAQKISDLLKKYE